MKGPRLSHDGAESRRTATRTGDAAIDPLRRPLGCDHRRSGRRRIALPRPDLRAPARGVRCAGSAQTDTDTVCRLANNIVEEPVSSRQGHRLYPRLSPLRSTLTTENVLESAAADLAGAGLTPDEIAALRTLATASVHGPDPPAPRGAGRPRRRRHQHELTSVPGIGRHFGRGCSRVRQRFRQTPNRLILGQFRAQPLAAARYPGRDRAQGSAVSA